MTFSLSKLRSPPPRRENRKEKTIKCTLLYILRCTIIIRCKNDSKSPKSDLQLKFIDLVFFCDHINTHSVVIVFTRSTLIGHKIKSNISNDIYFRHEHKFINV